MWNMSTSIICDPGAYYLEGMVRVCIVESHAQRNEKDCSFIELAPPSFFTLSWLLSITVFPVLVRLKCALYQTGSRHSNPVLLRGCSVSTLKITLSWFFRMLQLHLWIPCFVHCPKHQLVLRRHKLRTKNNNFQYEDPHWLHPATRFNFCGFIGFLFLNLLHLLTILQYSNYKERMRKFIQPGGLLSWRPEWTLDRFVCDVSGVHCTNVAF